MPVTGANASRRSEVGDFASARESHSKGTDQTWKF